MPKIKKLKEKGTPYSKEQICDKDVVIQVEKLTDSFIAEMTADSSSLQLPQVRKSAVDINFLPAEMLLKIFQFLPQNQLGRIARVCSSWNKLTKDPFLWKTVDVTVYFKNTSPNTAVAKVIKNLPASTTRIRLHFKNQGICVRELSFKRICVKLQQRCPELQELFFEEADLSEDSSTVQELCSKHLEKVKSLEFRHSSFDVRGIAKLCVGSSLYKVDLFFYHLERYTIRGNPCRINIKIL